MKTPLRHEDTAHVCGSVDVEQRVGVRQHLGAQLRIKFWKRQSRALADARQFSLCTGERRAGREPPEHHQRRPHPWLGRRRARAERYPEVIVDRKREALRHHADDGMWGGSQLDGPAKNRGITQKPIPPDVLADHDDGRRSLPIVLLVEIPSHQRWNPSHTESGGAHRCHADTLRLGARSDQVGHQYSECADLLNGAQPFAPHMVVVEVAPFGRTCCRVPELERDNPVTLLEGQRRNKENAINQTESADGDRNGHCNPSASRQRKAGILDQHPETEFDIQPPGIGRFHTLSYVRTAGPLTGSPDDRT